VREEILDLILAGGFFAVSRFRHDALLGGWRLAEFEVVDGAAFSGLVFVGCRYLALGARAVARAVGADAK